MDTTNKNDMDDIRTIKLKRYSFEEDNVKLVMLQSRRRIGIKLGNLNYSTQEIVCQNQNMTTKIKIKQLHTKQNKH